MLPDHSIWEHNKQKNPNKQQKNDKNVIAKHHTEQGHLGSKGQGQDDKSVNVHVV